jgi:hypothetical protein
MGNKFILGQEDGTVAGGNARGEGAVDLQSVRAAANQVAAGNYSVALGTNNRTASPSTVAIGNGNTASGFFGIAIGNGSSTGDTGAIAIGTSNTSGAEYGVVSGGQSNIGNGRWSVIGGGISNNQGSNYGTISGGQSNVASTNTHATVVGGQSNTASGQHSIVGGLGNTASGARSISIGGTGSNVASNNRAIVIGGEGNTANAVTSAVINSMYSTASGSPSMVLNSESGHTASGNNSMVINCGSASGVRSIAFNNGVVTSSLGIAYNTNSKADLYNQFSISNGVNINGGSQYSQLVASKNDTLLTGGTTVLSLDGTGVTNLIIPSIVSTGATNRMWKVKVEWVATVTTITGTATGITVGDYVYGESSFGFKRLAGTSTMGNMLSDSEASDNAIMDTCLMTYTAGASQELALTFTGPTFSGGGSVTMRVVAKVALVEVAF